MTTNIRENLNRMVLENNQLPDKAIDVDIDEGNLLEDENVDDMSYIIYKCQRLQFWLDANRIKQTCIHYNELMNFLMKKTNIKFEDLDDSCQITITAAKYYVKAVYRVKELYNL